MKTLIIVDMQNDFITGSLGTKDAEAIVDKIADYVKDFNGHIIYTRDTHRENYFETQEGQCLPIKHCVWGTVGWQINEKILNAGAHAYRDIIDKPTFGFLDWKKHIKTDKQEIYLCGTCTDICVVSNALILKAMFPEAKIKILSKLCAGTTKENHEAALDVMRMCQCEVIE